MSQVTASIPNPDALPIFGSIVHYPEELLRSTTELLYGITVQKVIEVASLAFIILSTLFVLPSLILDPSTSLAGIACVTLVSAVALPLLHNWVAHWWSSYWDAYYPIPAPVSTAIPPPIEDLAPEPIPDHPREPIPIALPAPVIAPAAANIPPAVAPDPLKAEVAAAQEVYNTAVRELQDAVDKARHARTDYESKDQGLRGVELTLEEKKNELWILLKKCADEKRKLIEGLVKYPQLLTKYGINPEPLLVTLPKKGNKKVDEEVADAIRLLDTNMEPIAKELEKRFNEICTPLKLPLCDGKFPDPEDSRFTDIQTVAATQKKTLEQDLATNRGTIIRIEEIELQTNNELARLRLALNAIDDPDASLGPKTARTLKNAKEVLETIRLQLAEANKQRLPLQEKIHQYENYGLFDALNPNDSAEDRFQFESEAVLMRSREEARNICKDDKKFNEDMNKIIELVQAEVLRLRNAVERQKTLHIRTLKGYINNFAALRETMAEQLGETTYGRAVNVVRIVLPFLAEGGEKNPDFCTALKNAAVELIKIAQLHVDSYPNEPPEEVEDSLSKIGAPKPKQTQEEIERSIGAHRIVDESKLNHFIYLITTLDKFRSDLNKNNEEVRQSLETGDLAAAIYKQAHLLVDKKELDKSLLVIRDAKQAIFDLKKKKEDQETQLPLIEKALQQRQGQLADLRENLLQFDNDRIVPLQGEMKRALEALIKLEVKQNDLTANIEELERTLRVGQGEKQTANINIMAAEAEQGRQDNLMKLAARGNELLPIMTTVGTIFAMKDDSPELPFKTILSTYAGVAEAHKLAAENRPVERTGALEKKNDTAAIQKEKANAEEMAFISLMAKRIRLYKSEIDALRGSRYKGIVLKSNKVRDYYHLRDGVLQSNEPPAPALANQLVTLKKEIQELNLQILKGKIQIALKKLDMNSFIDARTSSAETALSLEIDHARLQLATHSLKRHRMQDRWKTITKEKGDALREGKELIEMIKKEQQFVFRYYARKLHRDVQKDTKHAVKANLAVLNLILDRIYVEATSYESSRPERREYLIIEKMKAYFVEVQTEAKVSNFNVLAWAQRNPDLKSLNCLSFDEATNAAEEKWREEFSKASPTGNPKSSNALGQKDATPKKKGSDDDDEDDKPVDEHQASTTKKQGFAGLMIDAITGEPSPEGAVPAAAKKAQPPERAGSDAPNNPFFDTMLKALSENVERNAKTETMTDAEIEAGNLDPNSAPSTHELNSFLKEVRNKANIVHEGTSDAALIESKIKLIQLSLKKPYTNEIRFHNNFLASYSRARNAHQGSKYLEKSNAATAEKGLAERNPLYLAANAKDEAEAELKEAEAQRVRDAENARRETNAAAARTADLAEARAAALAAAAQRVHERNAAVAEWQGRVRARDAVIQQRNQDIRTRNEAIRARQQAMEGSVVEKISYLFPTAVLWLVYTLATATGSPLLAYISLSSRVSQNILLIGSATNLFVQGFFRGPAETPAPSNLLAPSRVAATPPTTAVA